MNYLKQPYLFIGEVNLTNKNVLKKISNKNALIKNHFLIFRLLFLRNYL